MSGYIRMPMECPNRYLAKWASLYGVDTNVMDRYCCSIHLKDKLPRGMEKKLSRLRNHIHNNIRSM